MRVSDCAAFPALNTPGYCQASSGRKAADESASVQSGDRPHKIRQQAVGRGVQAGVFFGDRQAREDICFEMEIGGSAGDLAHGRGGQNFFGGDDGLDAAADALRAADQFEGPAVAAGVAQGLRSEVADAFAFDVGEAHGNIHQDRDQGGGFDGGVPAVDVVGGVGFGYAEGLRSFQGFVEGKSVFHSSQNYVGGGVQDSVETLHVNCGHLIEERKNGDAVHDCGFEQEFLAARGGQVAQFAVGVHDGAFVGGDGVGSVLEGGADVVDGGL